jgi:small subunit ribosomal protein S17
MTDPQPSTGAAEPRRRMRQVGRVQSVAGLKSVVVQVDRRVGHGRYGKFVGKRSKFMAHDEKQQCGVGDVVEIVSTRPLSASKRWRVAKILVRGVGGGAEVGGSEVEAHSP